MKVNVLCILILMSIMGSCATKDNTEVKTRIPEDWVSEAASWDGQLVFVRYNQALKSFPRDTYRDLMRVSVRFESESPKGFPNDREAAILWTFEDTLITSLTTNDESIFAGTVTLPNCRHFLLYSSDINASKKKLESVLSSLPGYQVEHAEYADSIWGAYEDFYRK